MDDKRAARSRNDGAPRGTFNFLLTKGAADVESGRRHAG